MSTVIDENGFRSNVGIIIANAKGQVLWAKRLGQNAWQFPQGGVNEGETPEQAMYRELQEEVGLEKNDVELITSTRGWLRYRLPQRMLRYDSEPLCIGQKQKWFLLRLLSEDSQIDVNAHHEQEFDHWEWVSYWYPLEQVVNFKRDVYRRALKELCATHSRIVMLNARPS